MTRPLRPGRLAVRKDPSINLPNPRLGYSVLSSVRLPGFSQRKDGLFQGLWCYELLFWETAQTAAVRFSRQHRTRLQDHAALTEQCS